MVALAPFLHFCPQVATIGVRAAFSDYTPEELALVRTARRVFFPTARFANIFHALHVPIFPSFYSYQYRRSRILQTQLLKFLGFPHPRTRIYFGHGQKRTIGEDFHFPVKVSGPCANPGTMYPAGNLVELESMVTGFNPVLIWEGTEWRDRIELICIQFDCIGALRRTGEDNSLCEPVDFRSRAFHEIYEKTRLLLRKAGLDEISMEWGLGERGWQIIGMKCPPVHWTDFKGSIHNRFRYIARLIELERL